jgi:hypothetical protein
MVHRERDVLEKAVRVVAEQATTADALVDEAIDVGHGRSDPLVVHAKMLRLELLNVKADLERELEDFSLNCKKSASTCIGSAVSESRRVTGRTGSQRRTGSPGSSGSHSHGTTLSHLSRASVRLPTEK